MIKLVAFQVASLLAALLVLVPGAFAQVPVNLTVTMNLSAECAGKASFRVGDVCQIQISIAVPAGTTSLLVNLMSSPNRTSLMAQLCQPSIAIGSNLGPLAPGLTMSSNLGTSQFDQAKLNFGFVTNSGASTVTTDSTITIVFNAVVVENSQTNGTIIPIVGTVEHSSGQQIWVGQASLVYVTDTLAFNAAVSTITDVTGSPSTTNIGRYDSFKATLTVDHWRSYSLLLTAVSTDPDILLCSIIVESASWCYSCLASANRFLSSKTNIPANTVTLDLGYLVNTGVNSNNATGLSDITVTIIYQVLTSASAGSSGQISLSALFTFTAQPSQTLQLVHTVNYGAVSPETIGFGVMPTVVTSYNSTAVNVYQAFSINVLVTFPAGFDNQVVFALQANQGTPDNSYRYKICSIQVASTGANMPCLSCLAQTNLNYYSSNAGGLYDSLTWTASNIRNFQTYGTNPYADSSTMTQIMFVITGQVLPNALNSAGSIISVPLNITMGAGIYNYSATPNFTIGSTASLTGSPQFSLYSADNKGTTANVADTRLFYLDILTAPGAVYGPMNVQFVMPPTAGSLAAASICSVQLVSTGFYSSCVQQSFINNPANNRIVYSQTLDRFKNNVASIQLDTICNSADSATNITQADGLVRLAVYFQFQSQPSLPVVRTLNAYVYNSVPANIFSGSLNYTVTANAMTTNNVGSVYSYSNFTGGSSISGNSFGLADAYIKIPSSTSAGYYFQAMVSQPTSGGSAAFCTIQVNSRGAYVPCSNPFAHNYLYSPSNYQKFFDNAYAGQICSTNNITGIYQGPRWDSNSLDLLMIIRPSKAANGPFTLTLTAIDYLSGASVLSNPISFSWTAIPYAGPTFTPNYTLANASVFDVDPVDPTSLYFSTNQTYQTIYTGQTAILRYQLTLNEPGKFYDLVVALTSSLASDQFEINKLFISNVGDNFPCTSYLRPVTFQNGTKYPFMASLDMGNIAYYPIDPKNASASTIIVEAFVRIPLQSALAGSTASFTFSLTRDTMPETALSQTITGLNILAASGFTSQTPSIATVGYAGFGGIATNYPLTVSTVVTFNVTLNVPPLSNLLTKIMLKCVDFTTGLQFASVQSASILSMGRNIDAIMTDYRLGLIQPTYSRTGGFSIGSPYFQDTAVFDLGIVTNTMYAQKLGNYSSTVDDLITLQYKLLVVDESISAAGFQSSISVTTDLGGSNVFTSYQNVTLSRASPDLPVLSVNATILNDTTFVLNAGYLVGIQFQVAHMSNSTAEAYNVSVPFYFPPYIVFESLGTCSNTSTVSAMLVDSAVYFNITRLHFGEVMTCVFTATIDKFNTYSTYVQTFGVNPPTSQRVPYMVMYQKYPRIGDTQTQFYSSMSTLLYKPAPVTITGIPNTPLVSSIKPCQLTSSVAGSNPAYAITSAGWTSGYRSIYWYTSGATYLTIAFGNTTVVTSVLLIQLAANGYTTPFSKFRISFSDDGISYAYLPEVAFPSASSGASFVYSMPNNLITCRFMRIHLTDMVTRSDLTSKTSGLIVGEIYGDFTTNDWPLAKTCNATVYSPYYWPRSYLYIPETTTLFVCDENPDRTGSECYSTTDANSTTVLVLPKIVSTVVFWVRDMDTLQEFVYGVGSDKVSYLRTDDSGITWKAVSPDEFQTMYAATSIDSIKYVVEKYQTLSVSAIPATTFGSSNQWTVGIFGVYNSNSLRIDWFN